MDPLLELLSQLGLGLSTNAIYDLLKGFAGKSISTQQVQQEIQNQINMHGVSMRAETVINALAQKGFLIITRKSDRIPMEASHFMLEKTETLISRLENSKANLNMLFLRPALFREQRCAPRGLIIRCPLWS